MQEGTQNSRIGMIILTWKDGWIYLNLSYLNLLSFVDS